MKVGGLAVLFGCCAVWAGAAVEDGAHEETAGVEPPSRALQIVTDISLGLGVNSLVPAGGLTNVGPKRISRNGIEFSWIELSDGSVQVLKTAVHSPAAPSSCPLTLEVPQNDNVVKRGVAYIRVGMSIATLERGSNFNLAMKVYSFIDCIRQGNTPLETGEDLPVGTLLAFEYSHVLYTLVQAVQAVPYSPDEGVGGCGSGTGIDIRRPQCVCFSTECDRCRGVSYFDFNWKGYDDVSGSAKQCQISGDQAQDPADMEKFFSLVANSRTKNNVIGKIELNKFWNAMGATTSTGESLTGSQKTDLYNRFANLNTVGGGVDKSEFVELATQVQGSLFSQDQMDAYQVRQTCKDDSTLVGCGTCEL